MALNSGVSKYTAGWDYTAQGTKHMTDMKKRSTLKIITGAAAIAATPSIASAGNFIDGADNEQAAVEEIVVPVNTGTELTISLSVEPEPTIRLTNHSKQLLIVRHVYPGIVHAGEQTFDINSIFFRCAYAVSAGRSRTVKIEPTISTQVETAYPRQLYSNKPQRMVAITGRDRSGKLANSTRSFFAW